MLVTNFTWEFINPASSTVVKMSAPLKKRELEPNTREECNDDKDRSLFGKKSDEFSVIEGQEMEVQVDFEGSNPQQPDYYGIKTLLQQLFLKADVQLGEVTDLIISQNYVGSVIKQFDEMESDDETDLEDNVYGITTVINISNKQDVACAQELRNLLKQLVNEHATDAAKTAIRNVMDSDTAQLGLLINERIVNIPAQISIPLFENLISEVKRANNKNMPFNFSHYILICKLHKATKKTSEKLSSKDSTDEPNIIWSNPEEEIFAEETNISFEFSVENESDSGLRGTWSETDEVMPYRRILFFEACKLPSIISKIKRQVS